MLSSSRPAKTQRVPSGTKIKAPNARTKFVNALLFVILVPAIEAKDTSPSNEVNANSP